MGCDIHAFVEVKIDNRWELFNQPMISRFYKLFTKICGVRKYDDEITPISEPRGLPNDISFATKFLAKYDNGDRHSDTWLSAKEAGEIQKWYENETKEKIHHPPLWGYVFGNAIDSHIKYPEDCARLRKLGFQDARVVIWFDN